MLRKLFVFVICLMAAVATASAQTPPDNEIWYTTTDGRTISFNDDDLVSNSYNNGRGVLKFRDSVTSIEYIAFRGRSSLTSITIPNSVTRIESGAFAGCSSLTSITIPNSVTSIEDAAFNGCRSLISITIPNSVTSIGEYAFAWCNSLKSITIPNSVTRIEYGAFNGCSSLKSFKGKYASSDGRCLIIDGELIAFAPAGLTSYTIPNSVTSIEFGAFADCSSLASITIPNSVISIGEYAFEGCSSLKSITIPNSVTEIELYAFYGCSSLKSITIPDSVTYIGECVFYRCDSVKSIIIPNSVTEIGFCAFAGCSSLKSVKVANEYCYDYFKELGVSDITFAVSTLEEYEEAQQLGATKLAIDSNSKYASKDGLCLIDNGKLILFIGKDLTEYTIPESVTSIGKGAFNGCSRLKGVKVANEYCYDYFKDEVDDIAFYGANASDDGRCLIIDGKLERFIAKGITEYTIPESVTNIGEYAFAGCSSLKSITIPDSVTSIEGSAFEGCSSLKSFKGKYASSDGRYLIIDGELKIFIAKGITEYTIPDSVTSIGFCAFAGCSSLTSITIPNSVTSIGEEAFKNCSSLKSVEVSNKDCYDYFKNKVANIAFYGANASDDGRCLILDGKLERFSAKGITEYTIPESVTSIGDHTFNGCSNLTCITIPNSVTSIGDRAFSSCSSLKSIKVANKDCYDYFKDEVDDIAFYGANASDDGRCLIIDGKLERFSAKGITEYTIPESVTSIGDHTFNGCSNLTRITIPNSVTSIGDRAFSSCSSLKSVKVSNKYCYDYFKDKVDDIAFYGANASNDGRCLIIDGELKIFIAKGITEYSIPEGVTSVGEGAFAFYSSLTSINIPNSVTSIGDQALYLCSSLTSINIPNSVTSIGDQAFWGCSSLTSITIPNSVTIIGEAAFLDCSSLTSITIPNSVTSIGVGAFYGCSNLKSITIPNGVTSIERYVFSHCSSLTSITIPDSITSIERYAFVGCSSLTSITIPNSVTSIEDEAFDDCSSLTSITCFATTPPAISDLSIAETTMIYVPKKAVKAYKKDPWWSIYKKQTKPIK